MQMANVQVQQPHPATELGADNCAPARFLAWDSEFFGHRIARVTAPRLNTDTTAQLISWCSSEQIECLYLLASPDDVNTIRLAEENGFRFVDIRMTYERSLVAQECQPEGIRIVKPTDIPYLKRLAGQSFAGSRFYNDSHFAKQKCDELYATWLERSCSGYASAVLIAEREDRPAGFITCSLQGSNEGAIGLLAVDREFQGTGVGRALVTAALRYFFDHEMTRATVVTQGSNTASQRLYQRCGFVARSVQIWYHRWSVRPANESMC